MLKSLFKFTLFTVLALGLIVAAGILWLRFEYARVQYDPESLAAWRQVPVASTAADAPEPADCAQQHPQKKAWFGALHVHTAVSFDASSFGVTNTPDDAYRFARGGTIPLRLRGDPQEFEPPQLTISAPLDFMAVTDHAETLGEVRLCYAQDQPAYGSLPCRLYRGDVRLPVADHLQSLMRMVSFAIFGQDRSTRVCGADGSLCRDMAAAVWQENQRVTEAWLDRSPACDFTTFHGYEYSLAANANNLHRNVIFANETVPAEPLSAKDARQPEHLWEWLDAVCISGDARCNAMSIPHNSNWSTGHMFYPYSNRDMPEDERLRLANLRSRVEPLAEIMQVKGDSECRNGIASVYGAADEFCDFEKLRPASEVIEDCGEFAGNGGMMLSGCVSRYSYVRYALTAGLTEEKKLGVNPFRLGIVAATDTHIGAPAAGRERDHPGSHGNDRNIQQRLLGEVEVPGDIATGSPVRYNPGGIAGVYATENSREALFSAMQRRETFGTSGPRIEPRFFAGWDLDEELCRDPEYLAAAYRDGVPMGSLLPASAEPGAGPVFVASATRDARDGANLLQRIQVIKGWVDAEGRTQQAVHTIAGAAGGNARVDPDSCAVSGTGYNQLCTSWRDPDFDPGQAAVYYVRVLENPSCRWSRFDCLSLPEAERPDSCNDPDLPWQIQERAWTSPIWYRPGTDQAAPGGA